MNLYTCVHARMYNYAFVMYLCMCDACVHVPQNNQLLGTMQPGHIFTIEPMINEGTHENKVMCLSTFVCMYTHSVPIGPMIHVGITAKIMCLCGFISLSLYSVCAFEKRGGGPELCR